MQSGLEGDRRKANVREAQQKEKRKRKSKKVKVNPKMRRPRKDQQI
jgi:hypothetical protein